MSPRPGAFGESPSPERPGAGAGPRPAPEVEQIEPDLHEETEAARVGAGSTESSGDESAAGERSEVSADAVEENLEAALARSSGERDEYLEMLRRVQADFENYKKRMLRQQTELLERAAERLVVHLLPALDAFDLAREHLRDAQDVSAEGKALVQASALLFDALAKEGLEQMEVLGEPFDPMIHEAVEHVPFEDEIVEDGGHEVVAQSGPVVVGVLRAGYRWKGRVIRPPMVRVRG